MKAREFLVKVCVLEPCKLNIRATTIQVKITTEIENTRSLCYVSQRIFFRAPPESETDEEGERVRERETVREKKWHEIDGFT